jgi:hypothetical protein
LSNTSWLNYREVREQSRNKDSVGCYAEDVGVVRGKESRNNSAIPITTSPGSFLLAVGSVRGHKLGLTLRTAHGKNLLSVPC